MSWLITPTLKDGAFQGFSYWNKKRSSASERFCVASLTSKVREGFRWIWGELQATLKAHVSEFNDQYGNEVMRIRALGDGSFEVRLGEPGCADKIATLTYSPDPPTVSWQIFGGAKGQPIVVGLRSTSYGAANVDELLFTVGQSYPSVEEISQQVISALLPC